MTSEITVALLSLAGTLIGSFSGIIASSKLTAYRIEQLEKKVDRHNNFASRIPLLERDIQSAVNRIAELERRADS